MKKLIVAMVVALGMTIASSSLVYAAGSPCKKECTSKKKECVKAAGKDRVAKKKCREDLKDCVAACKK